MSGYPAGTWPSVPGSGPARAAGGNGDGPAARARRCANDGPVTDTRRTVAQRRCTPNRDDTSEDWIPGAVCRSATDSSFSGSGDGTMCCARMGAGSKTTATARGRWSTGATVASASTRTAAAYDVRWLPADAFCDDAGGNAGQTVSQLVGGQVSTRDGADRASREFSSDGATATKCDVEPNGDGCPVGPIGEVPTTVWTLRQTMC